MGHIVEQTDACGATTRSLYTILGKPYRIENPDGSIDRSVYDQRGNLTRSFAKNGTKTKYEYDYQSRVTGKTVLSSDGSILSSNKYTYNAFHLKSETDGEGNVTLYEYDGAGRLSETNKDGRLTTFVYDNLGRVQETREHFDGGYVAKIQNFDFLNRLIEERTEDDKQNLFSKTRYHYDADGNRDITEVHHEDGKISVTTTRYNIFMMNFCYIAIAIRIIMISGFAK